MDDTQQPVETPISSEQKKNNKTTLIIIIVAILILLGIISSRFMSSERMIERAIEDATGGEANVDISRNGETMTFTGGDGETITFSEGGNVQLPGSWPNDVPVMDGAMVSYSGTSNPSTGESGAFVMFTTERSVEDVSAYYQNELAKSGWTIEGTMNAGGYSVFSATKGERSVGVSIGGDGAMTTVTIGVGE